MKVTTRDQLIKDLAKARKANRTLSQEKRQAVELLQAEKDLVQVLEDKIEMLTIAACNQDSARRASEFRNSDEMQQILTALDKIAAGLVAPHEPKKV